MTAWQGQSPPLQASLIAQGAGWRVQDVICRCGPRDRPFEERHAWTAVAAVVGGVFTYRSDRGRAVMASGSLMLGTAGQCFQCGHEHGTGDRCVSFHYSPDFIEDVAGGLKGTIRAAFTRPGFPPQERLLPLLTEAQVLVRAPDPLRGEQLALAVATAALRLDHDAISAPSNAAEEARACEAIRIIEDRLADPLTIAGLAREVGMTRRRFATCFRRAIGVTPYNYILSRRLQAAAERLQTGSEHVLEIALDVGFGDLSEFTRRFRAMYGSPPGVYRRLQRDQARIQPPT